MLNGKKILLGVCGSIAAYKSTELVRQLVKQGAQVKVLMTGEATKFISALTLETLSKNAVISDISDNSSWNNHVELGLWADLYLVAPASANTIAKFANGLCDNIVTATYLSARCPVFLAPAMDVDMWQHPSTKGNMNRLIEYGNYVIDVGTGELASGLIGPGRMAEPENIVAALSAFFQRDMSSKLRGKKILISAGPTREPLDPVRFFSNHSSGKMGIAIASAMLNAGAEVTLVVGPVSVALPLGVRLVQVETAAQMFEAMLQHFTNADVCIMCAAVADFTPDQPASQKLKKSKGVESISLKPTVDILAELGRRKLVHQILVGFALETRDALNSATAKLESKNLDLIVVNTLEDEGAGFGVDTNKVTFINRQHQINELPLQSKHNVATRIVEVIIDMLPQHNIV